MHEFSPDCCTCSMLCNAVAVWLDVGARSQRGAVGKVCVAVMFMGRRGALGSCGALLQMLALCVCVCTNPARCHKLDCWAHVQVCACSGCKLDMPPDRSIGVLLFASE
jgi:hypothetical protein